MKFWTTDPAFPDKLVIDMVQCHDCDKWIPDENMELHLLYHKHKEQENNQENYDDDKSLPAFVMETIPCEDCMVLVPKQNWDIHRAHVCRGRKQQDEDQQQDEVYENEPPPLNNCDDSNVPVMETVECEACHILVPIHNLDLHQAHACTALYGSKSNPEPLAQSTSSSDHPHHQSYVLGDADESSTLNDEKEEWECPRCTYLNHEEVANSNVNWTCSMCEYSLASDLENEDDNLSSTTALSLPPPEPEDKNGGPFWRSLVKAWLPEEIQKFLPPTLTENQSKREKSKNASRRRRPQKTNFTRKRPNQPPSRSEVRHRRSKHLSWIERERQQYLQLLKTTRQEQKQLQECEELENITAQEQQEAVQDFIKDETSPTTTTASATSSLPLEDSQVLVRSGQLQDTPQTQPLSKLELLHATEQLCLHHLEQLRRTHWVQELTLDISLLGLPRWRNHLHYLLHLYQSAGEMYIDNIIWELRMHFMQYAILEVMALLELAVWKGQLKSNGLPSAIVGNKSASSSSSIEKHAYRNDRDISIICQSVLPFLGRPLTPALRAL